MRIAFLCPPGPEANVDFRSGKLVAAIQQQLFTLSKELAQRGHDVYILRRWTSNKYSEKFENVTLVNINQPYPFLKRMKREDNQVLLEALLSFIMYLLFSVKVLQSIRKIGPDIVNVSSVLQGFFICHWIKSTKVYITHSHDIYVHNTRYKIFKKIMLTYVLRNCNSTVALTESIKKYLETMRFKVEKIIPNGIDVTHYSSTGDYGYVLYSGKLVKHKCVSDLIESFSKVPGLPLRLIIVGEGPEKVALTLQVKRLNLDSVKFFGFLSEADYRDALSKCSFFVLPSIREAFGVVIIEAMASGKPVIARRITGPADIITSGYDGLLFKNDVELAKYVDLLCFNKEIRLEFGHNARITAEKKYSMKAISAQYEDLYKSLLQKGL